MSANYNPTHVSSRRQFLCQSAVAAGAGAIALSAPQFMQNAFGAESGLPFKISLAEWSLNKSIKAGKVDNKDFSKIAKEEFGIEAVEFVNQFFMDKATNQEYLNELNKRADDLGVKHVLIMVDREGDLGDINEAARQKAVENHYKWVDAAKKLGCHSIRVNAATKANFEDGMKYAADGLRKLSEFAAPKQINVIVENHGGLSSDGKWLSGTIAAVDLPNCGTLPDFGNFYEYDRYQGVMDLMPKAKAVSAKSYDFDEKGDETKINYKKMLQIVLAAGYHGYVGIEYEGKNLGEFEGIKATKALLERLQKELAA